MSKTSVGHETFGFNSPAGESSLRGTAGDGHAHHHAEDAPDHLAHIYEDQNEQFAPVVPFFQQGLERGERCLYVVDEDSKSEVLTALRASDSDLETAIESGDLTVLTAEETYLETGSFDRGSMLDFWKEWLAEVRDEESYTGVRAAAGMTWALDSETDLDELTKYEAMLNDLYSGEDYVVLCQYDLERFPSDVISDVIHTHPLVVHDETLYQNTQYSSPGAFLNSESPSMDIDRTMTRLSGPNPTENTPTPLSSDGGPEEPRILVFVADPGNRRVLIESLGEKYDVVTVNELPAALRQGAFDLCLLDPASFEQARDVLIDHKEAQTPRILPYLLIRREDTPLLDDDAQQYIDDVIVMPTRRRELTRRVGSLLQLRDLSLELERKNDELAERNEQLEYLVNAASHELRNSLNIAQGYAEQLDEENPGDNIRIALDRMEHLIENLLTVSDTELGHPKADTDSIAFSELLRECWEMVSSDDAELEVIVSEGTKIRGVPELVQQLVENLLRNAIEHSDGAVMIQVGLLSETEGFYVADDGPGIPDAEREAVFEEGYSTGHGSGIGLTIVEQVVDAHDWAVRVTESTDGGARFEITGVSIADE